MSVISQRVTLRWKEWIPLLTQQQRLRNLVQIIAYNIRKGEKPLKCSYYYTLHLTTMSAPFYTSEKVESDNPKWEEVEINEANGAANGVVIRLWYNSTEGKDEVLTVWGVYFSGLCYLGPRLLLTDPSSFHTNTIVFHMQGGYFTASHCFKEKRSPEPRVASVRINANDVRPSYSVNLLSRLHMVQQAIKKQTAAAESLRERISAGSFNTVPDQRESAMLRRLLNRSRPKPQRQEILLIKKEMEWVRFRIQLLTDEKNRMLMDLRTLGSGKENNAEFISEKGIELMELYQRLHKDIDRLQELKRMTIDTKDVLQTTYLKLHNRRRQLIAELSYIYPIAQVSENKYTICGVHLPNSEDFAGFDETMISVALGFVAHMLQMIAYFLHMPLRYPVCHNGSRSKIIDHIIDKLPDKEREFPLFSRSQEKLLFNYGVYLLNKNIAQLRWYCGLSTSDLRATLSNLMALLNLKIRHNPMGLDGHKRTLSGSSLEMQSSSPVSRPLSNRQRLIQSVASSKLSFSLDKGLDKINVQNPKTALSRQHSITQVDFHDENGKNIDSCEEQQSAEWMFKRKPEVASRGSSSEEIENLASLMGKINTKSLLKKELTGLKK